MSSVALQEHCHCFQFKSSFNTRHFSSLKMTSKLEHIACEVFLFLFIFFLSLLFIARTMALRSKVSKLHFEINFWTLYHVARPKNNKKINLQNKKPTTTQNKQTNKTHQQLGSNWKHSFVLHSVSNRIALLAKNLLLLVYSRKDSVRFLWPYC